MKQIHAIGLFISMTGLILFQSCREDDDKVPNQPGFIVKTPENLTIEAGETFELNVPEQEGVIEYTWTVPESLEIVEGQGSEKITVKAWNQGGSINEKSISVVARNKQGESRVRFYYKEIIVLTPPPTLEKYTTKRYGAKTWMTENLDEKAENSMLGRYYNNDDALGAIYGRLYTWDEAVTGIPQCTPEQNPLKWGSSGIDDAGNPYTIDGSVQSFNIQIQGVCPEGWHIPNAYDWYDLLVAIKNEYNVPGTTLNDVANNMEGYIIAWERDNGFTTGLNLTNWGFVGAYLKGSSPSSSGGLWNGGTTFSYGGNSVFPNSSTYPLYLDERIRIGFNILPGGQWTGSAYNNIGAYSYHWSTYIPAESKPWRFTLASGNVNFSNAAEKSTNGFHVRCVANY